MLFDAILPVLASGLFLVGIGALVLLMLNIIRDIKGDNRNRHKGLGPAWRIDVKRGVVIVMAVGLIGLGNFTFWINGQLRLYSPVMPGLPLGTISIMQKSGSLPRLVYASIDREGREALEVFPVREAGFRLVGERIRWSPMFRHFGLGEHFKLSRIEFYSQSDAASTYGIDVRQGSTHLFQKLKENSGWLPFVSIDSIETQIWDANSEYSRNIFLSSDHIIAK